MPGDQDHVYQLLFGLHLWPEGLTAQNTRGRGMFAGTVSASPVEAEDALDQLTHLAGLIMRPVSLAYYQCPAARRIRTASLQLAV